MSFPGQVYLQRPPYNDHILTITRTSCADPYVLWDKGVYYMVRLVGFLCVCVWVTELMGWEGKTMVLLGVKDMWLMCARRLRRVTALRFGLPSRCLGLRRRRGRWLFGELDWVLLLRSMSIDFVWFVCFLFCCVCFAVLYLLAKFKQASASKHSLLRRLVGSRTAQYPWTMVCLLRGRRPSTGQQIAPDVCSPRPAIQLLPPGPLILELRRPSGGPPARPMGH